MSSSSSNSSNKYGEEGNTKPPPKKQISPAKRWCFTLNNYTDEEVSSIVPILEQKCDIVCIGKEIGEQATPHLQGYFELKVKQRPLSLGLSARIHFEKCKGNRTANIEYCSKDSNLICSKGCPKPVRVINPDRDWEQEILKELKNEPDDRTIFWYWGDGNIGKTSFCKYLTIKHSAIALGGRACDMRNGVIEYSKTNGRTPDLVLINIPRSFNSDYISYEGIENIKDMYFYSGKYEGGMVCGNPPHLFIFANEPPDKERLSGDRWVIRHID